MNIPSAILIAKSSKKKTTQPPIYDPVMEADRDNHPLNISTIV